MAQLSDLENLNKGSKISDNIKECPSGVQGCLVRVLARPDCNYQCKILSSVAAELTISGRKYTIGATGYYSDIEIGLMWGKNNQNKDRSHFGLILNQQKGWSMNNKERKCLLFHHMGCGVEIAVGCEGCVKQRVKTVYGSKQVSKPNAKFYKFGRSRAAVRRFLDDKSLGRNIRYKYNHEYANGTKFYTWKTSNCMRLAFDLLLFLKLPYEAAVNFTINAIGKEKIHDVYTEIAMKEENKDFFLAIFAMWKDLKANDELEKIVKLINAQYNIDAFFVEYLLTQLAGFSINSQNN